MPGDAMVRYFGGPEACPRVSFPGRAFPVAALYLEHALALIPRLRVDPHADWSRSSQAAQRRSRQKQAQMQAQGGSAGSSSKDRMGGGGYGGGGGGSGRGGGGGGGGPPMMFGETARDVARRFPQLSSTVHNAMAELDEDAVNVALIVELCSWYMHKGGVAAARRACRKAGLGSESGSGGSDDEQDDDASNGALAVLVFLPGTKEIQDVQEALQRSRDFGGDAEQRSWVLPLHGALPPDEQRRVFERPPSGVVKVILSTNVAETSVTIDDVVRDLKYKCTEIEFI